MSAGGDIVFSSNRAGSYDIFCMSSTGSNVKRLTSDPSFEGEPAWSMDDKRIAYVSTETGERGLYIINRDGEGKQAVLTGIPVRNPLWLE